MKNWFWNTEKLEDNSKKLKIPIKEKCKTEEFPEKEINIPEPKKKTRNNDAPIIIKKSGGKDSLF
jgi:hypothetical protein